MGHRVEDKKRILRLVLTRHGSHNADPRPLEAGWTMSSEGRDEHRKRMEMLRRIVFIGEVAMAGVFLLFAEILGDIAYIVAALFVVTALAYFALWHRIFKSTYGDK
jgi:hypothetical protein